MSILNDIYTRLSTYAGLTALVSARIYPEGEAPEEVTAPYCTFQQINKIKNHAFGVDIDIEEISMQVDMYSIVSQIAAFDIGVQVHDALSRWRGAQADKTIKSSLFDNEFQEYDSDAKIFRVSQIYLIKYA